MQKDTSSPICNRRSRKDDPFQKDLDRKLALMGILNCTPNSFYEKARFPSLDKAILRGIEMEKEGADIIDIGGESSAPFTEPISEEEEISRVVPLISELSKKVSIPISIDSYKPAVVEKALDAGASFINDISGFSHPLMRKLASESGVPICIMHMQEKPKTMQINPDYPKGIIEELLIWFENRIELLLKEGVKKEQIIIDPGIGFGKTVSHNLTILKNLGAFHKLGFPILIGLSRKSFMQKILQKSASDLLSTTLSLNTMSLVSGASIIRVHDVKEHAEILKLLQEINNAPLYAPHTPP